MIKSPIEQDTAIMLLAETWAACRSKDPNTKVGACIYEPTTGAMYFGYNGFPRGIADLEMRWQRPTKYDYVIHAEENAILKAGHANLDGCILYVTHLPCHRCMLKIIQVGIKTVYYKYRHDDSQLTRKLASEAFVALTQIGSPWNIKSQKYQSPKSLLMKISTAVGTLRRLMSSIWRKISTARG